MDDSPSNQGQGARPSFEDPSTERFRLPESRLDSDLAEAIPRMVGESLRSELAARFVPRLFGFIETWVLRSIAQLVILPDGCPGGASKVLAIEQGGLLNHHAYILDVERRAFHFQPAFAGAGPVLKLGRIYELMEGGLEAGLPTELPSREEADMARGMVPNRHASFRSAKWVQWKEATLLGARNEFEIDGDELSTFGRLLDDLEHEVMIPLLGRAVLQEHHVVAGFWQGGTVEGSAPPSTEDVQAYVKGDMRRQRYRAQAIQAYPFLSSILINDINGLICTAPEYREICHEFGSTKIAFADLARKDIDVLADAIDNGDRLSEAFSKALRMRPWIQRFLRHRKRDDLGWYSTNIAELVEDLDLVSPGSLPAVGLTTMASVLRSSAPGHVLLQNALRYPSQANIKETRRFLANPAEAHDIGDYVRFIWGLGRWLLENGREVRDRNLYDLLGAPTLAQLRRMSRTWHQVEHRVREQIAATRLREFSGIKRLAWTPLFWPSRTLMGHRFTCLTSQWELDEEASKMQHCVAGYGLGCMHGRDHIVRIMRGSRHVGTMQVQGVGVRKKLQLVQARGLRNAHLDTEAIAAVDELLNSLNSGSIEVAEPSSWGLTGVAAGAQRDRMLQEMQRDRDDIGPTSTFFRGVQNLGLDVVNAYEPSLQVRPAAGSLFELLREALAGPPPPERA